MKIDNIKTVKKKKEKDKNKRFGERRSFAFGVVIPERREKERRKG